MPPIIETKAVMYTVKDLLQTIKPRVESTPFTDKCVHFVGIGGCGMSGLAQMLLSFGAKVSGTDRTASSVTRRLSEIGATIVYEQVASSIPPGTETVVYSAAIKSEHPEMVGRGGVGAKL